MALKSMGDVTVVTSLLAFVYSKSKEGDLHNICYFFLYFLCCISAGVFVTFTFKAQENGSRK